MIRERPGEKNDREHVLSNIDNDRWGRDMKKLGENYEVAFGKFIPWWEKRDEVDK